MRLIDVDEIGLTDFEIVMCNGDCNEALKMLLDKISNQPTAYSVDKVVEELKNLKDVYDHSCLDNAYERGVEAGAKFIKKKAIEIVKQGGVSDDVCEWKTNDNQHMFAMLETECGTQTMIQKLPSYKYCPYCGKKIKVVE